MSDLTITNPFALMKLFIVLFHFLASTRGRYVSDSAFDLSVAAAEPRPVFLEPPEELQARVLPLVADNINFDDSPLSEASEKVEKILQRPLAFSYDQSSEASSTSSDEEEAEIVEVDQQPDAVDYYKHVKNVEPAESDEGGGSDGDKLEINEKHSEEEEEEEDHEPIKNADEDDNDGDQLDAPDLAEQKKIEDSDHKVSHLPIDEKKAEDSDYQDLEHHANHKKAEEGGGSAEDSDYQDSEHHANHKKTGGSGGGGSGGHKGAKEYKKGGGKEHHSSHKGEKGEKGDKGYKGHHYNEKGEKGHKTKEDHDKEYEEKGGHKKKHHHDDGYAAEHHQGEKGHKSSKYHENGDHSKGHSTKGEHIIHKKDEYDKRQEFYDESHEEDGFEKDGEYVHESDYKKGGHEKGGFVKGGEESAQHGKKHHYDKGGHYKEGKGHKGAAGHDSHYDHEHKKGEKEDNSGGKKWSYSKGDGGGGGGHKHSGKYEHADSVNIPIRVVQPIIRHKDNDVQSNIPKLVLEEDVDNFKQPDVIYPPLTPHEFVRGQRRYDEDRIVISKPNHKKIVDERINIQRRNDEVDDANYEDEIINPELERKQAHTKDHSVFRSVLNRSTDNKIVDEADKKSKDLNTETTKFKSINSDYLDEYDLLDDKKNDEVGVYSVYTLGDYRLPAVPKIQPTTPATGTEGYEKLKDVAITSDSAEYSSSEETTTQNLQEELNRTILTDDDVDASKKVSKNIHDNKEIGPITDVSKDVEDIEEDEELRNVKDTDDNEELRHVKDTDDGEELTNVGDTKVLTATMKPIVVGDEVEEESEN